MADKDYHYMLHKQLTGLTENERKAVMAEANLRGVKVPDIVVESIREHVSANLSTLDKMITDREKLNQVIDRA